MSEIDDMLTTFKEDVKDDDEESKDREAGPAIDLDGEDVSLPRKQQEKIELCRRCDSVVKKLQTKCENCGLKTRYTGPAYRC